MSWRWCWQRSVSQPWPQSWIFGRLAPVELQLSGYHKAPSRRPPRLTAFGCRGRPSGVSQSQESHIHACENTRAARQLFSQLRLEPNHTGLTAQSLFFEESCRVKRSDTQTSSNFSNNSKRVLKLQNVLLASPNKTSSASTKLPPNKFTTSCS